LELWLEYEECSTREAQLVSQIDKFDMYVQAYEYEEAQGLDLAEFFKGAAETIKHPEMKSWLHELLTRRASLTKPTTTGG